MDDASPPLSAREVHVLAAALDRTSAAVEQWTALLSDDEIARARRFHFQRDRDRYVVGRAELRRHLAGYVGEDATDLRFSYSDHGKPFLAWPESDVAFNISHSEALAVFAYCRSAEIGIDVERMDDRPLRDGVAEQFFSPSEVRILHGLPPSARPEAFLRCWTRKEAYLKARGDGLTLRLDSFDVSFAPDEAPRLTRSEEGAAETAAWSFFDPSSSFPGYVAALAVRGGGWSVRVLEHGASANGG